MIDYDYIMGLVARFTQEQPGKQTMSRGQLINLLASSSNLMEEREEIIAYINTLEAGKALSEQAIRDGYQSFKAQKAEDELSALAERHGLERETLQGFVKGILDRMIFDGEQLSDLFEPLELGWKVRSKAELALMDELVPFLKKQAAGREISGLAAYE
jgi:type I restriction enzyme R subunit